MDEDRPKTTGASRYSGLRWVENTAYNELGQRYATVLPSVRIRDRVLRWEAEVFHTAEPAAWRFSTVERKRKEFRSRTKAVAWVEDRYEAEVAKAVAKVLERDDDD